MKGLRRRIILFTAAAILAFALLAGDIRQLSASQEAVAVVQETPATVLRTQVIPAARGEIFDRNGVPLVTNRPVYALCFDRFGWQDREAPRVIREVLARLAEDGVSYEDALPISQSPPWRRTCEADSREARRLVRFLRNYGIEEDADLPAAVEQLCRYLRIPEDWESRDIRVVLGVFYDMFTADFSYGHPFTLAEDVSMRLTAAIAEQTARCPGVTVEIRSRRQYETEYAAHVLGRTGPIPAGESERYAARGYPLDAVVGLDGAERAFEDRLRGTDGSRLLETELSGKVLRTLEETPARSGDALYLTLDLSIQQAAEDALARHIAALREEGVAAEGGAAAVVSVSDGSILALASCPTYRLDRFSADYARLAADPEKPMFNRAIAGTYAPGSTFKMVTAAAALGAGVLAPDTVIDCEGIYSYYAPDYLYHCWIWRDYGETHGPLTAAQALQNSCNCFFYEAGRLAGIRAIDACAARFGLGQPTGIELAGEARGVLAGPDSRAGGWYAGDTLQAAIGQSDHLFTPLQLAGYAAALTNGGQRYALHLLDHVSYAGETLWSAAPQVLDTLDLSEETWETIREGMLAVTEDGTASRVFADFPIRVLGKSGSAQVGGGRANGIFILAAPAEAPEIAAAVVIEHGASGNNAARVARDILAAYFGVEDESAGV